MHCSQGKAVSDFCWSDYTDSRASATQTSSALFRPDDELAKVFDDILLHAVFDQVSVGNRWRRPRRVSLVAAHAWVGYRLRKGSCRMSGLLLDPFAVRLTREESAMRLALEAQRWRVRWDVIAIREPGADAVSAGGHDFAPACQDLERDC